MNMTSWKTTSAGILSIVGGVTRAVFAWKSGQFTEEAVITCATAIVTGVGLLFARDNNVTSEDVQRAAEAKKAGQPGKTLFMAGIISLTLTGCLVPQGSIKPGADPVVVQAEALAETAGDSMDAFVQWEYRNRAGVSKDVTAAADLVREFGPGYLRQLKGATRMYKANRTQPNLDATRAAIKTLQDLLEQARTYYQPKATT
jgi:hypothetical protein